jgi:hypothetical protein
MRSRTFFRKQRIYTAIERENARASDAALRAPMTSPAPATCAAPPDNRDPLEIARAASAALKGVA